MVEVIYTCKQGRYPFGRGKQSQHTYMQHIIQAKDQNQVNKYRQLNSIMKKLNNPNIMRLEKVLKQNFSFHMIYEFHNKSLQQRLKQLQNQQDLANIFVELQNVFESLINEKLKAQLYLQFMGVDQNNQLKVWLKPDQLQYMGNFGQSDKKLKKHLIDYYQTQRTRIHLQIQQIFENSQLSNLKKNIKKKQSEKDINQNNNQNVKSKNPNFVIEGNTLVFLNKSTDKTKPNNNQIKHNTNQYKHNTSGQNYNEKHLMSKANHLMHEQRPVSKTQNTKQSLNESQQMPDVSKMSVAQKVQYYKKQKQNTSQLSSTSQDGQIIVKDSSTSNVSPNDLSKSSNNDSNIQIKTQMINKHKMKIITSQQVQIQGNSDDDLQKLARQKIQKINKQKQQKSRNFDNSMDSNPKVNTSNNSGDVQRLLKGLDENSRQQQSHHKYQQENKQINNKITEAKLKAKQILDKYSQKLKK